MGAFENPFFSIKGQLERVGNVVNVLAQSLNPLSKAKPVANVSNPLAKSALEFVAAHPVVTGLAAGAVTSGSAVAAVAALTPVKKIALATAASVVVPTFIKSPTTAAKVLDVGAKINPSSFGADLGTFIENPSKENIKTLVTENKETIAVLGGAAAIVGGIASAGLIANIANTQAVKENTKTTAKSLEMASEQIIKQTSGKGETVQYVQGEPIVHVYIPPQAAPIQAAIPQTATAIPAVAEPIKKKTKKKRKKSTTKKKKKTIKRSTSRKKRKKTKKSTKKRKKK